MEPLHAPSNKRGRESGPTDQSLVEQLESLRKEKDVVKEHLSKAKGTIKKLRAGDVYYRSTIVCLEFDNACMEKKTTRLEKQLVIRNEHYEKLSRVEAIQKRLSKEVEAVALDERKENVDLKEQLEHVRYMREVAEEALAVKTQKFAKLSDDLHRTGEMEEKTSLREDEALGQVAQMAVQIEKLVVKKDDNAEIIDRLNEILDDKRTTIRRQKRKLMRYRKRMDDDDAEQRNHTADMRHKDKEIEELNKEIIDVKLSAVLELGAHDIQSKYSHLFTGPWAEPPFQYIGDGEGYDDDDCEESEYLEESEEEEEEEE